MHDAPDSAAAWGTLPTCGPCDVDALTAGQVHQVKLAHLDALAHAAQGVQGGVPRFAHACSRMGLLVRSKCGQQIMAET